MSWVLAIGIVWALLALPMALLIGRGLRLAGHRDEAARRPRIPDLVPGDLMAALSASTGIAGHTRTDRLESEPLDRLPVSTPPGV